jgi:hypothetical protein
LEICKAHRSWSCSSISIMLWKNKLEVFDPSQLKR